MKSSNALCIFIKKPVPGFVKTRLQPQISPEDSLLLYEVMTRDLLDSLTGATGFDLFLFFWPPDEKKTIKQWLEQPYYLVPQKGENLGERMSNAFEWTCARSYRNTIVIGSDIPGLRIKTINTAFNRLQDSDLVVGPSSDGGYYLIGSERPHRSLFDKMPWSSDHVYEETINRIHKQKLSVAVLEEMDDMDTYQDARHIWQSGKVASESRLFEVLKKLFEVGQQGGK